MEAVTALQDCILDIKTWMTADKLNLNDDKTELIGTCAHKIGQDKHIRAQDLSRESVYNMQRAEPRDVVRQPSEHENCHQQDVLIGTLPSK